MGLPPSKSSFLILVGLPAGIDGSATLNVSLTVLTMPEPDAMSLTAVCVLRVNLILLKVAMPFTAGAVWLTYPQPPLAAVRVMKPE